MVLVGLVQQLVFVQCSIDQMISSLAYKGSSAVVARGNLGLVSVDKDPWVTSRAAAAIACHNSVVGPGDRHLVYQFHR